MCVPAMAETDSRKIRGKGGKSKDFTVRSPLLQIPIASSVSSPAFGRCRASCARRPLPQGKGLLLLLFVYFVESFAFYCATKSIRELLFEDETNQVWGSFLFSLVYNTLGRLFYPLAGVLADTFWGRYKVIKIGLWLIAFALGFICINLSIIDGVTESVGRIFLPIVCILLVAIGSACVEVNAISFGVDQLPQGCTSDQISSYFFWYDFTRNSSTLLALIVFLLLDLPRSYFIDLEEGHYYYTSLQELIKSVNLHYKTLTVILIAASAIACTLLLHIFKHYWYFKNSQRENPVKTIINVSWYSLTVKRHLPIYRRTFRYGEARQPRIELAKKEFDGIFEAEEVENVKSFYQILFLILSLGGFLASNTGVSELEYIVMDKIILLFSQASSMLSLQFEAEHLLELGESYHILAPYLNNLVNTITIVIFLPFFNHVALPFLPLLSMSLKLRLAIGLTLNLIAILIAVFLQATVQTGSKGFASEKFLWLLLPAIVLSVAETITFVSCKIITMYIHHSTHFLSV